MVVLVRMHRSFSEGLVRISLFQTVIGSGGGYLGVLWGGGGEGNLGSFLSPQFYKELTIYYAIGSMHGVNAFFDQNVYM